MGLIGKDFATRDHLMAARRVDGRVRRQRTVLVAVAGVTWIVALLLRLYSLQVANPQEWQRWAVRQHHGEVKHLSERGAIYDRDGRLLAVSLPTGSIFVHPRQVREPEKTARTLSELLGMSQGKVLEKLRSQQPFVWIKRQIPRQIALEVRQLGLPGVDFMLESKRMYPFNQAAATLIGRVGTDGNGLSGLELTYDKYLSTPDMKAAVMRDAVGKTIAMLGEEHVFEPPRGNSLTLTIDAALQLILDEELERGRQQAKARHGLGLLADADTGEILAMSHAPTVNLNDTAGLSSAALKNIVTETVFEPGSIMKPIVAAIGIELGVVTPDEQIFCENGRYGYGKHTIKDVHGSGTISFEDVVVRSSNIGMTKVGIRIGGERLYKSLRAFGFGGNVGFGFPASTNGILRHVSQWAQIDTATHSFGQGMAVTPAQVVRAVAAIVNGGTLRPLSLVHEGPPGIAERAHEEQRLLSDDTAKAVQHMMVQVVEDSHGTGRRAQIPGVRVGGKTGTAQKARTDGRGYAAGKYVASFVGFADGSSLGLSRRLVLLVAIDEPKGGTIYGGTLAAPVFQRVMYRTLNHMVNKVPSGSERDLTERRFLQRREPLLAAYERKVAPVDSPLQVGSPVEAGSAVDGPPAGASPRRGGESAPDTDSGSQRDFELVPASFHPDRG